MNIYEIRNVVQTFEGRNVLRIDHLDVPENCILGVRGHNGSGKSTLLAILAFLTAPASGTVRYAGRPVTPGTQGIRREVTLLTQEPYLLKRSVRGNVEYGLRARGETSTDDRVNRAMLAVGLPPEDFLNRSWSALSGGEAQRVALAARLVLRPKVLLLDEPTSNLDPESAELIHNAALAAREDGSTLVAVSHDQGWLESVSDQIVKLEKGTLLPIDTDP